MKRLLRFSPRCAGCSWTSFRDLPTRLGARAGAAGVGSSDYGVAHRERDESDRPGELAVLCGRHDEYSVLDFDAKGSNETLNRSSATARSRAVAAAGVRERRLRQRRDRENGIDDGPLVLIHGAADKLTDQPLTTTDPVDAATFAGSAMRGRRRADLDRAERFP